MLTVINIKLTWNDAEELVMVANIYLTMYQIRYNLMFQNLYEKNLYSELIYLNTRMQSVKGWIRRSRRYGQQSAENMQSIASW